VWWTVTPNFRGHTGGGVRTHIFVSFDNKAISVGIMPFRFVDDKTLWVKNAILVHQTKKKKKKKWKKKKKKKKKN
jgi:hypothetical protein